MMPLPSKDKKEVELRAPSKFVNFVWILECPECDTHNKFQVSVISIQGVVEIGVNCHGCKQSWSLSKLEKCVKVKAVEA